MAPGAGRVEPNQRKRAGIRLRQAASAKATPKAFASEAARARATPKVFASPAARQGRAGSVIQRAEDGGRKARSKEAQASGEGVGTLKLARGA